MTNPSVAIIGSGNMAYHLAVSLSSGDLPILQVYNRSQRGLRRIHKKTGIPTTRSLNRLVKNADIYILAVSDDAIENVAAQLSSRIDSSAVVAHTSGNHSMNCFEAYFQNFGVLYPLQSLNVGRPVLFEGVPIFISASNIFAEKSLKKLGKLLSKDIVMISDKKRSELHIPAVLVNNFVNHFYALAHDYMESADLPFRYLLPLMQETLDRIKSGDHPKSLQTGPAIRRDQKTIDSHMSKLNNQNSLKNIYKYMTKQIQKYHDENNQGI